jgi:perosamine synthetase
MDLKDASSKITKNTKAIIAVHVYGAACDSPGLRTLCDQHGLYLIEDCAEAIGTKFGDTHAGKLGDVAAFSFFGNKTITTGEGGMVCTDNEILADKIRHLKGQGLAKNREYWHDIIGYNYRMTNICAAIGLAQLERVHEIIDKKRAIGKRYESNLIDLPLITQPEAMGTTHSFWMCSLLLNDGSLRDALRLHLKESGIETRPFFFPVHLMPMYFVNQQFPVTEDIASRGINIPSYPDLKPSDLDYISITIQSFFK